jgi:hypothetical protein
LIWYHGSKQSLPVLHKQQAAAPLARPSAEALEAIYFTPSFALALACAVRPPGVTEIDLEKGTLRFGNPEAFDPDRCVYVYRVDHAGIPESAVVWVDELQIAVMLDEVVPDGVEIYESRKVLEYFHLETEADPQSHHHLGHGPASERGG